MAEQVVAQPANIATYSAALEGAVLFDESSRGRIFMRGKDRAELLHRISTAHIKRLQPGQGVQTVMTSPIGRIIDLVDTFALDDALLLISSPGQGPQLFSLLKKNIFFNDKVTLEPAGRSHALLALYGPLATSLLQQVSGVDLSALPLFASTSIPVAGSSVLVARKQPIGGNGFMLLIELAALDAVRDALLAAGAQVLDSATYDVLRVEQGYGEYGRELSLEYIPLETGLLDAISFNKGCYVGQEIIARMESRNRLAKSLRGLRLQLPDDPEQREQLLAALAAPGKLSVEGKESGDLTSVVVSPRFGPIALAYVRSAHAEPGSVVGIADSPVQGEVVSLPF